MLLGYMKGLVKQFQTSNHFNKRKEKGKKKGKMQYIHHYKAKTNTNKNYDQFV